MHLLLNSITTSPTLQRVLHPHITKSNDPNKKGYGCRLFLKPQSPARYICHRSRLVRRTAIAVWVFTQVDQCTQWPFIVVCNDIMPLRHFLLVISCWSFLAGHFLLALVISCWPGWYMHPSMQLECTENGQWLVATLNPAL